MKSAESPWCNTSTISKASKSQWWKSKLLAASLISNSKIIVMTGLVLVIHQHLRQLEYNSYQLFSVFNWFISKLHHLSRICYFNISKIAPDGLILGVCYLLLQHLDMPKVLYLFSKQDKKHLFNHLYSIDSILLTYYLHMRIIVWYTVYT